MRKSILGFVLGFLLIGSNGFAADGDLIVNGNVGVGTSTPTEKLDVNGTVKATGFAGPGIIKQVLSVSPTNTITTTSTSFIDMDGMNIDITTGNSILLIFWNATLYHVNDGWWAAVETQVDGTRIGPVFGGSHSDAGTIADSSGGHAFTTVTAGTHTVKLRWRVHSGTAQNAPGIDPNLTGRTLTVIEIGQ